MNDIISEPVPPGAASLVTKPMRRWIVWGGVALLVASLAGALYSVWQVRKLNQRAEDLEFQQTAAEYGYDNDLLTPDVGSIQFMHKGYSITFDSVQYAAGGLELTGTLGNPTQITLTSINLKLTARDFLYKNREKILKDPFFLLGNEIEIGSGQTTIPYLGPGKTAAFSMTIPNVKQTKDSFQIVALFSGERYSY